MMPPKTQALFILIRDLEVESTTEITTAQWDDIKNEEVLALSVDAETQDVYRYCTVIHEWQRQYRD